MHVSPDENFSHIYFNFSQNFRDRCCPVALTDEPPWCSLCTKITTSRNNTNEQRKYFNYFKSNLHNASYDNGVGSSFNIL